MHSYRAAVHPIALTNCERRYIPAGKPGRMGRVSCGMAAIVTAVAALWAANAPATADEKPSPNTVYDVVVYGGTSGGVAAAVQSARMGKSVVLIEPSRHIGGLSSGGLGATDIGNKAAIGGISREFYHRVWQHYQRDDAWKQQRREEYRSRRQAVGEETMWTFEPHVAEKIFRAMLRDAKVPVVLGQRLDRKNGAQLQGGAIRSVAMEDGATFHGKMFIDATYEGDLMAAAGVRYHVGRESNSQYDETLNGVQTRRAIYHQFVKPVDPYLRPGDPSSGLLPGINGEGPGEEGAGDHRVQAYCFRLCATDAPENRRPWPKPAGYDELQYELLLRNFEAGDNRIPWAPSLMPNRKTDSNNNFAVSTDYIGMNYDYPEADYATRENIIKAHEVYQKGLMWTLANHPRVPEKIREYFQTWGLAKDEFTDNDNWPHQLYVREARRMVSDYVMTQHNCQGRKVAEDPVGLAAYTMDSHHVQRHVKDHRVLNEGDVQVGGFSPYPISYRSIVPAKDTCSNLLVPVCLSASHIAYGSIRMEPVFMVLGQSAATAAALAIDHETSVQDVEYPKLRERLLNDEQVLEWTGPRRLPGLDPKKLPGIVLDDDAAKLVGEWLSSSSTPGFVGSGYLHDNAQGQGTKSATFAPQIPKSGRYDLRLAYTPFGNRATNVRVTIDVQGKTTEATVNQRKTPPIDKAFVSLGRFTLPEGKSCRITILNRDADGHVIVDALQLVPIED